MQALIEFPSIPNVSKSRHYALYVVDRDVLRSILHAWPSSIRWTLKRGSTSEYHRRSIREYHQTAIHRAKVPAPIRQWLDQQATAEPTGRILYFGCGRDKAGAKALECLGQVHCYDPFHPDLETRVWPVAVENGPYREIHCHYVLNVCTLSDCLAILRNIHSELVSDGCAVISVRRDL